MFKVADDVLARELRGVVSSGDEYASSAKPQIDWDNKETQDQFVDSRAKDGYAVLVLFDGRELDPGVSEAMTLLATVLGQDL